MKRNCKLFLKFMLLGMILFYIHPNALAGNTGIEASLQQGTPAVKIVGKVLDEQNNPMIGVTVKASNLNEGTVTNNDGYYSLTLNKAPAAIVFSYIGYKEQSIKYNGQQEINAKLEEDQKLLDEVVVTGYQTISKERSTGSFAIVNNQTIEKRINPDLTSALDGQVAGVSTYNGDVVIRGRTTISAGIGTNPLLVIDGLPTERKLNDVNINDVESLNILKDAAATSIYGSRAANGVIVITTKSAEKGKTRVNFVADWTVTENPSLSDYRQASTDTYINYEMEGWMKEANYSYKGDVNAYILTKNIGIGQSSISYVSPLASLRIGLAQGKMSQADFDAAVATMRNNDFRQEYMDEIWRTPFRQNYNLSVTTGSERQSTYVSFNYSKNLQAMKTSDDEVMKAMIKNTQKITNWFSADFSMDAQYGNSNLDYSTYTFDNLTPNIEPYNRILADNGDRYYMPYTGPLATNPTGVYFQSSSPSLSFSPQLIEDMQNLGVFNSSRFNVLDELDGRNTTTKKFLSLRSLVKLNFNIYKGLKFSTSFDYEQNNGSLDYYNSEDSYLMRSIRNRYLSKTGTAYTKNIPDGGFLCQNTSSNQNYTFRNQLDYNTTIKEKHNITALLGAEMREYHSLPGTLSKYFGYDPQILSTVNLASNSPNVLGPGITSVMYNTNTRMQSAEFGSSGTSLVSDVLNRFISFYGNAAYSYKNLYNFTGSVRVDQTNLFGKDPKYRYRPLWSIGASWNVSNEGFMKGINWLDMLTIRGSYGVTGNVNPYSSPFILITKSTTTDTQINPQPYNSLVTTAPNPKLRWEKTSSYAMGIDFSILKNLLSGKIEGYYKYTDDLLTSISTPAVYGYSSAVTNSGAISNRGVEVTLSSPWYKNNDWKLTSTLIYSYNKNIVEKVNLKIPTASSLVETPFSYYEEGRPYNALYAYHCEGITHEGTLAQQGIPIITKKDGTSLVTADSNGKLTVISKSTLKPEEAIYMGSLDPLWNGSFLQSVQFKNLELSAMLIYYGGNKIRKPTYPLNTTTGKISSFAEQAWTPENPNSNLPKTSLYYVAGTSPDQTISDYWRYSDIHVVKGDMIRLRNVSLSYNLPAKFAKAAHLQKVRITAQANNIWFWSAAGDVDPETYAGTRSVTVGRLAVLVPMRNSVEWTLPAPSSYLFRLEATF